MIIPTDYTPIQIAVPDDGDCESIDCIWDAIYSTNQDIYSYISHLSLAREYNLIYALIKTDNLKFLNSPYTVVPLISAENINFYKLENSHLVLKEENNIKEIVDFEGSQVWYKNGEFHRDNDLPAIIETDGTKYWYQNGKYHRDNDLPALIIPNGSQFWYKNGQSHRDNDLPAIIHPDGSQFCYKNGERHRDNDLPAVILHNGTQEWYKDGKLHRDNDLPALICKDGRKEWWKNGVQYANPS